MKTAYRFCFSFSKLLAVLFVPVAIGLFFSSAYSQTTGPYASAADSLAALIKADQPDTTKVIHLNALGTELMHINPDTAILLGNQALELSTNIANGANTAIKKRAKKFIADSYSKLGVYYWVKGEYELAIFNNLKALDIRNELNDKQGIETSYNNIGLVFYSDGDYPKALEYFFKALKIAEDLENMNDIAMDLGEIGAVYSQEGDYTKALAYFLKELDIDNELHNKYAMSVDLGNIADVYHHLKNSGKALEYYIKALKLSEELHNKHNIAMNFGNIGTLYDEQGEALLAQAGTNPSQREELFNKALEYYLKALAIVENTGEKKLIAFWLGGISSVYQKQKKHKEAEEYALKALKVSTEIGELSLMMDHSNILSEIYAATNRNDLAYKYHVDYRTFKDSLFNDEKNKAIGKLEAGYEMEKAEMERIHKEEEELKTRIQTRNRRFLLEYSGIAVFLLIIGLIIARMGFVKVSPPIAKGVTFFAFLLFFEFLIVLLDPTINKYSGGEPAYNLLFNAAIAACIFPVHAFFEKALIKRLTGGIIK